MLRIKRVYDPPADSDGRRVLVDRLWPRGLSKQAARMDLWLKEIAPSDALRRWYGHEPAKWEEFRQRYFAELEDNPAAAELVAQAKHGRVTLLFAARDDERNNAAALRDFLLGRSAG